VVNKTITKEVRAEWQAQIDVFVADHSQPNPYILLESGKSVTVSFHLVRLKA
jgi:hypothetical protein